MDLLGVLESYPAPTLIQASVDRSTETAMSVTQLQERARTKLFIREDDFGRLCSCLVYIPRDRYNTNVRLRMADILKDTFGGESVEFSARVSESALSRRQFCRAPAQGRAGADPRPRRGGRPRAPPRRGEPHLERPAR